MQVMKLAHAGKTRLLHLKENKGGDGLNMRGREMGGKAVHQVTPRPKAVFPRHPHLGHPSHGALKAVTVQVGERRQQGIDAAVVRMGRVTGLHRRDAALSNRNPNVPRPALRQSCVFCENHLTAFRFFMYRHITIKTALEK